MDQHEERLAVAALFADQLAKARHIIATTEARIAESKGPIEQMAQALVGRGKYIERVWVEWIPSATHPEEYELAFRREPVSDAELLELPVREMNYEVTKGAETVHRHTEPTAPRWPLTVATDGERNGRLAWVPGL